MPCIPVGGEGLRVAEGVAVGVVIIMVDVVGSMVGVAIIVAMENINTSDRNDQRLGLQAGFTSLSSFDREKFDGGRTQDSLKITHRVQNKFSNLTQGQSCSHYEKFTCG